MTAWEQEKTSDDYKKTVEHSQPATAERKELKERAHAAQQNLVRGRKINDDVYFNRRFWHDLSAEEKTLLNEFNSGTLKRRCDESNAAFGWDRNKRGDVQSVAARLKRPA